MSYASQLYWDEQPYCDITTTQDYSNMEFCVPPTAMDSCQTGKGHSNHPFTGMTRYLNDGFMPTQELVLASHFEGRTDPYPMMARDSYNPSSPGSESLSDSGHSDNTFPAVDHELHMPAPSQNIHMICRTDSTISSPPGGMSRVNSLNSSDMDYSSWASRPSQGCGGLNYHQAPPYPSMTWATSPEDDIFKMEECDDCDVKADNNVVQIIGQLAATNPTYQQYPESVTLSNSPPVTRRPTIKSEDDEFDYESDGDYGEVEDTPSDGDYVPAGSSKASTRRNSRRAPVSDTPKKSRILKSKAIPRRTSTNGSFKSAGDNRHPCVFQWAGCTSTWKTKNEWKRHAMTQHLVLESYHCKLCTRDNENGKGKGKMGKNIAWDKVNGVDGQVFNRKDLFTQHVKRMHAPTMSSQCQKGPTSGAVKLEEANWLKTQQEQARYDTGKKALEESFCPKTGCSQRFSGPKGWDARMEHIWTHFVAGAGEEMDMGEGGLRKWAVENGVVENVKGRWLLKHGATEEKTSDEEDAPGDDEY